MGFKENLLKKISSSLRETDLLGTLNEDEFVIMLPETDYFDSLLFIRQLKEKTAEDLRINDPAQQQSWQLLGGSATYSRDGEDFNSLSRTAHERIEKSRRSLASEAELDNLPFWDITNFLLQLTPESEHISRGESYFHAPLTFDLPLLAKITELIGSETLDRPFLRGAIFINQAVGNEVIESLQRKLTSRELRPGVDLKLFILGVSAFEPPPLPNLTQLELEDERLNQNLFLFYLGELSAYGFVGFLNAQGDGSGFHSADPVLVELMIHKLQKHYQLDLKL